jgi:cholesterol transport system auxiliary component
MKNSSWRLAIVLALATPAAGGGCALFPKGEVYEIRWFSPEATTPRLTAASVSRPRAPLPVALELGRVNGGIHLGQKIAHRDTAFELGFYDDKRWTERPEVYVRRQLARTLFEERGFPRAVDGEAVTLDVEVQAFEEVRGPSPRARIQLRALLYDDRRALLERTFTVERPIVPKPSPIDGLVRAMAEALDEVAEEIATSTEAAARTAAR